jgi:hypothetical protein
MFSLVTYGPNRLSSYCPQVGKFDVDFEDEDEDDWGTSNGCRIMAVMYETDQVCT